MDIYKGPIITEKFLKTYENKTPHWGFNGLGYIVYKRTYSRLMDNGQNEEWHETIARCINGAQLIGADYTKEEAERLFDLIFNLKCNFAGRMLWQLGTGANQRFGANSLLNCFAYETEIITSEGIKKIGDLVNTSPILMTEYGKWIESEIKAFGIQSLYKLELNKGKAKKTIFTTENHRWFRKPRRNKEERNLYSKVESLTKDLKAGDYLISTYGQGVKSLSTISHYGIAHGIVFGDGCCSDKKVSSIRLCGKKNKQLLKYFINPTIYEYEGDLILNHLPSYFKEKPDITKHDKTYLYGWLAGYFAADGHIKEDGQACICSSKKDNILFVRDVCSILGINYGLIQTQERIGIGQTEPSNIYSIGINISDLKEDFFLIEEAKNRFLLNDDKVKSDWKVISITKTDRKEEVYCAVVPYTHSFVLADNILTGNCWFCKMNEPEKFCFLFENLMLGGGVGFSVRREDVHELPKIKENVKIQHLNTKDAGFIVPDSREGWVNLLRKVLRSYFQTGKSFTYSTILIRGYGEAIKGFGGTASGPGILIEGITNICKIFESRAGKKLRSIDVLDICNVIGSIVVSGNVRRSAQIALGDPDDYLFIRAKRWDINNIPNWRAMSNNSIYADDFSHISNDIWEGYKGNGEPYGLINIKLSQKMGRLGEPKKDNCEGFNPCAEITLSDNECCNLSELYLNNINSEKELIECATLLYKTQKAICALPFIHEETNKIVHKNMRIGLGVTGICQSFDKISWLDKAYLALKEFDKKWSSKKNWPESIKLTTVKPSGTLSLLAGATPGIHPAYSKYYIRRVRMASDDKLIKICKDLGYHTEYAKNFDGSLNHTTVIVEFPCFAGDKVALAKEMSAVKQLDLVKQIQTVWSDNAVSVTVYYKKEELPEIKEWLKNNYEDSIKSVSFLLHNEHGFAQAPYEEITDEKFLELALKIKPISEIKKIEGQQLDMDECSTGACPIK